MTHSKERGCFEMQPIVSSRRHGQRQVNREVRDGRAGAEFWKHQFSTAGEELAA